MTFEGTCIGGVCTILPDRTEHDRGFFPKTGPDLLFSASASPWPAHLTAT